MRKLPALGVYIVAKQRTQFRSHGKKMLVERTAGLVFATGEFRE
jgi:hypothetical protein